MAFDIAAMIAEFHAPLGQQYGAGGDPNLRMILQTEEHCELIDALASGDRVAIAQELADVVYVAYGTAHSMDIPLDYVIEAVHAANMAKFGPDGPVLRPDGKLQKPSGWVGPDVAAVLSRDR